MTKELTSCQIWYENDFEMLNVSKAGKGINNSCEEKRIITSVCGAE